MRKCSGEVGGQTVRSVGTQVEAAWTHGNAQWRWVARRSGQLPPRWRWPGDMEMPRKGGVLDIQVSCHPGGGSLQIWKCAGEEGARRSGQLSPRWMLPGDIEMCSGCGVLDIQVSCHPGRGGLEIWKWAWEVGGRMARSVATQVEVACRYGNAQGRWGARRSGQLPPRWMWPGDMEMCRGCGVLDIQVSCQPGRGGLETWKWAGEVGGRMARSVATQV